MILKNITVFENKSIFNVVLVDDAVFVNVPVFEIKPTFDTVLVYKEKISHETHFALMNNSIFLT